ncbi:actin-7-related [Anaeramoeba ignava]|uniref:Actin-7-related n=1 Tax=Anaeramoeba ignava TaxID=1746090 RepID=A0A9Q0LRK9_ANAIG|nr:actin-7-related [Anaeramoeba ignava]
MQKTNENEIFQNEPKKVIVMDNGTTKTKIGFAGDDSPTAEFSTILGRPVRTDYPYTTRLDLYRCGDAFESCRGLLTKVLPVQKGIITDWEHMEIFWEASFKYDLRIQIEEHPLILTEKPWNRKKNKEITLEYFFEFFHVPKFLLVDSGRLSLLSFGQRSGTVIEIGEQNFHVSIYNNTSYSPFAFVESEISGREATEHFLKLLSNRSFFLTSFAERQIAADMKNFCSVSLDFAKDFSNEKKAKIIYEFPDGQEIDLYEEVFLVPEIFFQPSLIGLDSLSVQDAFFELEKKTEKENFFTNWGKSKKEIFKKVYLTGGSTMFPNFAERLQKEINNFGNEFETEVISTPERKYSPWIGGSILGSLKEYEDLFINKKEYEEFGDSIIYQKF